MAHLNCAITQLVWNVVVAVNGFSFFFLFCLLHRHLMERGGGVGLFGWTRTWIQCSKGRRKHEPLWNMCTSFIYWCEQQQQQQPKKGKLEIGWFVIFRGQCVALIQPINWLPRIKWFKIVSYVSISGLTFATICFPCSIWVAKPVIFCVLPQT